MQKENDEKALPQKGEVGYSYVAAANGHHNWRANVSNSNRVMRAALGGQSSVVGVV